MINIIAVFLGGGMGSLFRWLICSKISTHWGTLTVNILGAFLIGVLYQYISLHSGFRQELKLLLMTGVLGGFTTFSSFALFKKKQARPAGPACLQYQKLFYSVFPSS